MRAVFWKEFKSKRGSLIGFCVVVLGLMMLYIPLFPSIQAQAAKFGEILKSLGSVYKAIGVDSVNFDTFEKYIAVELYSITWPILAVIFAASRAGTAVADEIDKGTMGTMLALPIWRPNLYLAKYLAGLLSLMLFVAVGVFGALPVAALFSIHYQSTNFITLAVGALLFTWSLYSFAMFLSAVFSEKGRVYLLVGVATLMMYVLNVVASLKDSLSRLKYFSIFHYFNASEILVRNQISNLSYMVFIGIIVLFTFAGIVWFTKRDVVV